ncbi:MAG: hypothetical protein NZ700_16035 [Gemmataceae bacterium]|nr:hypothetical protein [Gemmataceae bacterium]MDW8264148.1 hypothetical protein [Gemmataceae bacterium]
MAHSHHHDDPSYYLEQLCTIGIGGALGGVCIMMYQQGMLRHILAERFNLPGGITLPFHAFVLWGGIVLVGLVTVRAVTLWFSVGECQHHGPHHDHPHHGHDHHPETPEPSPMAGQPAEAHHGHEHAWNPWRYIVLLLPVVLYFLNLPNAGFSQDYIARQFRKNDELENTGIVSVPAKGSQPIHLGFLELDRAAGVEKKREEFEGEIGRLQGQFVAGSSSREFSLARMLIRCCAADVVPLRVIVISPTDLPPFEPMQWVEVTGQIQFRKVKDRNEYVPILQLASPADVVAIPPPASPFLQQ